LVACSEILLRPRGERLERQHSTTAISAMIMFLVERLIYTRLQEQRPEVKVHIAEGETSGPKAQQSTSR
jgi:hypothetical protein